MQGLGTCTADVETTDLFSTRSADSAARRYTSGKLVGKAANMLLIAFLSVP